MDDEYNPTDEELYAIFGEEPPKRKEAPSARLELSEVDPFLNDDPPPYDEPNPFYDTPFVQPEPVHGSWAQPPTMPVNRNNRPPHAEKPTPDTPAAKEPRRTDLTPGAHVTVTGYVFVLVDEEKRVTQGEREQWRSHRTVWRTECRAVRCLFLGWTQLQGGWREPGCETGNPWDVGVEDGGMEYVGPQFVPDKYINVAVVMPLDIHDRNKFRKPFRCLPSQIIVESAADFLLLLGERNRKFNK